MCFEKPVDGAIFGGAPGSTLYPAMAVVQMGWVIAVSVVQPVVRTLVFDTTGVPEDSEVSTLKSLPQIDDLSVIYLDSYDELRRLDQECAEALHRVRSRRHEKFLEMCQAKGLPLNESELRPHSEGPSKEESFKETRAGTNFLGTSK